jgi:YHS domain-containing protein
MVEDPITKTTFLPEDAKGKLEHAGKTYYFSTEESLKQFKEKHAPAPEAKAEPKVTTKPAGAAAKPSKK